MRWKMLGCMLGLIALTASVGAGDNKADEAKMQGMWICIKMTVGGKDLPEKVLQTMAFEVKGSKVTDFDDGKRGDTATFTLDATKKPKTLDVVHLDGQDKGKKMAGLYEIDGDVLKICFGQKERPKEIASPEGSDNILMVLKKKK